MAYPSLIQDLSIALTVPNHNPALLTPDFLISAGIIPKDWELAIPPIVSQQGSRLVFQNDITLLAQPGSINFAQPIGEDSAMSVIIPRLAYRYVKTLTNLEYQSVSIQPKCFLPIEGQPDQARQYITGTLIADGPWKQPLAKPVKATLKFVYPLKDSELRITVAEAQLQQRDSEPVTTVMFAGTFAYSIDEETPQERLENLKSVLDNCSSDLKTFQKVVATKFQIETIGKQQTQSVKV